MSNLNYTNWWRNGTVDATKNSNEITGASTYWSTTNINPGDIFIDSSGIYEVQSVTDDTHLTLATPYLGETGTGLAYAIIRNFTATTNAKVAAQTSELMYEFARFIDSERSTIAGKSAYEIWQEAGNTGTVAEYLESLKAKNDYQLAVDNGFTGTLAEWLDTLSAYGVALENGYTGTQEEWLESLKAAGEWSNADGRITGLEALIDRPYMHNLIPRFKNLGTEITAEQYAALRDKTYDDLYVGDYWELTVGGTVMQAVIVQLGGYCGTINRRNNGGYWYRLDNFARMVLITHRTAVMNDEATTAGGYLSSKMCTEILPALELELEEAIGQNHIQYTRYAVPNSNVWNAQGGIGLNVNHNRGLALPSLYNIFPRDNISNTQISSDSSAQYALFRCHLDYNAIPYGFGGGWLQEPVNNANYDKQFICLYENRCDCVTAFNANTEHAYNPHFLLIP